MKPVQPSLSARRYTKKFLKITKKKSGLKRLDPEPVLHVFVFAGKHKSAQICKPDWNRQI
jgi:hypothetical protein